VINIIIVWPGHAGETNKNISRTDKQMLLGCLPRFRYTKHEIRVLRLATNDVPD
jgi:hypothetical protein